MTLHLMKRLAVAAILATAPVISAEQAGAETYVGKTVESRMLLAFKANDTAVQAVMPEGWKAITLPKGPLAGANFFLVVMDQTLRLDPEGKPDTPAKSRVGAFFGYGVSPDVKAPRMYLTRIYEPAPVLNPYDNSIAAGFTKTATKELTEDGKDMRSESWTIAPEGGGEVAFSVSYAAGVPSWSIDNTAQPYSAVKPDFFHIYRYSQLAELLMSKGMGKPLAGEASHSVSVPELAGIFDGTEELVAILSVPIYVRDTFEP
ncbi:hypothetical protein [Actibacterium sp.]|uniref:hypothetical protein n=1 Tax=Actibacterium sp. TaxID=1872125 RepID=UPI003569D92B